MGEYSVEQVRQDTVEQIEVYLEACGLARSDMILTDAVIIVAQRGVYDTTTGTSLVVTMVPTDTAGYALHGLLDMAKIEQTENTAALYRWANNGEDD